MFLGSCIGSQTGVLPCTQAATTKGSFARPLSPCASLDFGDMSTMKVVGIKECYNFSGMKSAQFLPGGEIQAPQKGCFRVVLGGLSPSNLVRWT